MGARTARLWVWLLGLFWLTALGAGLYYVLSRTFVQPSRPNYFTEVQAREGVLAYAQHCASYHGPDLLGDGAPALVGEGFWERWDGASVADLYSYIHGEMPPGRSGSLSQEAYVTATAYILRRNGFPAGEELLAPGAASLDVSALEPRLATARPDDLAPSNPGPNRVLFGRLFPVDRELRLVSQQEGSRQAGTEGDLENPGGGTSTPQGPDTSMEGSASEPSANEGQPGDEGETLPPVAPEQRRVGDLRLTVLPPEAEVRLLGPVGEVDRALPGGTRVVAGLPPGSYRVTASLGRVTLAQTVEVRAGKVAERELIFGTTGGLSGAVEHQGNDASDPFAGVTLDGDRLYAQNCLACHGPEGGGLFGPALAENPRLEDPAWTVRRILLGANAMPAFAGQFTAAELATVASYIRTNFGNAYSEVTLEEVRKVREEISVSQLTAAIGPHLEAAPLGHQRFVELCSACHGTQGGGDIGPPLAGNPALQDEQLVITTMLYGRGLMPAFSLLSDEELAAIASYIRTQWSNSYAPVEAVQIEAYRPQAGADSATRTEEPAAGIEEDR
jgi:mono/diheme cytochrome c family protein